MPLRVAIPNSVINPTMEATERTPPARQAPTTPTTEANGRLSIMISASLYDPNAVPRIRKMPTMTPMPRRVKRW